MYSQPFSEHAPVPQCTPWSEAPRSEHSGRGGLSSAECSASLVLLAALVQRYVVLVLPVQRDVVSPSWFHRGFSPSPLSARAPAAAGAVRSLLGRGRAEMAAEQEAGGRRRVGSRCGGEGAGSAAGARGVREQRCVFRQGQQECGFPASVVPGEPPSLPWR